MFFFLDEAAGRYFYPMLFGSVAFCAMIGLLFLFVLLLSFWRSQFWCIA